VEEFTPTIIGSTLICLAGSGTFGLLVLLFGLKEVFKNAPRLKGKPDQIIEQGISRSADINELTVVVPTYNEAANIKMCLTSLFEAIPTGKNWQVLLVDDGCTDNTVEIANEIAHQANVDEKTFGILKAGPRPSGERWVGKNWACTCAMEQVQSTWVLFLDADVQLQPDCLERAVDQAIEEQTDLLSLVPRLMCGCLAEWMVQPIMAMLLALGYPIKTANDPSNPTAFAAGPFMLFRRSAYLTIGGHRAMAGVVIEDLALARRIKGSGFRLRYLLGLDAMQLRMYQNFPDLWEGWSKNWFLGLDSNVIKALSASAVVFLMFAIPWLVLASASISAILMPTGQDLLLIAFALALLGIGLQLQLRLWSRREFQVPLKNWWLMGAGGIIVGAIGPTSIWRTLTGRGWTWKGRSLA